MSFALCPDVWPETKGDRLPFGLLRPSVRVSVPSVSDSHLPLHMPSLSVSMTVVALHVTLVLRRFFTLSRTAAERTALTFKLLSCMSDCAVRPLFCVPSDDLFAATHTCNEVTINDCLLIMAGT